MTLNPGFLSELEMCGLTNAALEPLMLLLRLQLSGSMTLHVHAGVLVKWEVRQAGSLKNASELAQVPDWLTTEPLNGEKKRRN